MVCSGHLPNSNVTAPQLAALEIRDIEGDVIDVSDVLRRFPLLENVSIVGGNITKFMSAPQSLKNGIKVLELEAVGVETVSLSFLKHYPRLKTLNLRNNYLQSLPSNFTSPTLKNLFLTGNRWNCSEDLSWVLTLDERIVRDLQNLTCFGYRYSGKPLLVIAKFKQFLQNDCPFPCVCTLLKVVPFMDSNDFEPIIEVNCTRRGLTELPDVLPKKTKMVYLEDNDIEDVSPLKGNPIYKKVLDLYLDNNRISSIEALEGSYLLKHFRVLSLQGNKLTELPSYALDNALEHNPNMPNAVRISLGNNPWRCDCVFTPVFQEMLQKFAPNIQDISRIRCSYVEGDENSFLPIIELTRSSVCRSPSEYSVQALDLLNGVLASLIVLILGKLAYDYYYFKKTGRLPWIVTKMP